MDLNKHLENIQAETGLSVDVISREFKIYYKDWKDNIEMYPEEEVVKHFINVLKAKHERKQHQTDAVILSTTKSDKMTTLKMLIKQGNTWTPAVANCFKPIKRIDKNLIHSVALKRVNRNGRQYLNVIEISPQNKPVSTVDLSKHFKEGIVLYKSDAKNFNWGPRCFISVATGDSVFEIIQSPDDAKPLERGTSIYVIPTGNNKVQWILSGKNANINDLQKPAQLPVITNLTTETLKSLHNQFAVIECVPLAFFNDSGALKCTDHDGNVQYINIPQTIKDEIIAPDELEETENEQVFELTTGRISILAKIRQYGEDKIWIQAVHRFKSEVEINL